jgi:Sugar phosphate isomerases/epimerases
MWATSSLTGSLSIGFGCWENASKRVHVKDFRVGEHRFVYLLQGDVNWREVMAALKEIGYDGWITAELPPYPHAPDQMVRDTAQHLDRIIKGEI